MLNRGRVFQLIMVVCGTAMFAIRPVGAEDEPPTKPWQHLVAVRAVGGFKDNVLLSADLPDASSFIGGGVEMIAWRPVGSSSEFQAFFVGEHRQFLSAQEIDKEQTLVTQASYRHNLGADWTVAMPVEYIYVDQVLDVSATEAEVRATRVQGHTLGGRPAIRRHWEPGTLEFELAGLRQLYAQPLDDTWEMGGKLSWLHEFRAGTRGDLFYDFAHVWYDEDTARTSAGDPIPGSRRRMQRHEVGMKIRHEWGEQRTWRVTGRLSGLYALDQEAGYFDYLRPNASVRVRYRRPSWLAEAGIRARHYAYRKQVISDVDDSPRRRSELAVELRGERAVASWLRVVAEYSYEQTFANRTFEEYSVNTVSCGLEASF